MKKKILLVFAMLFLLFNGFTVVERKPGYQNRQWISLREGTKVSYPYFHSHSIDQKIKEKRKQWEPGIHISYRLQNQGEVQRLVFSDRSEMILDIKEDRIIGLKDIFSQKSLEYLSYISGITDIENVDYHFEDDHLVLNEISVPLYKVYSLMDKIDPQKLGIKCPGYYVDPEKPMVALTFDDGPSDHTSKIMESIRKAGGRATFFILGSRIDRYRDVVSQMKKEGFEMGNHTFDHVDLRTMNRNQIQDQLNKTWNLLKTGPHTLLRPPYGAVNKNVREACDSPLILWSIDTLDWKHRNPQKTVYNVMSEVKDGDIILMHDIFAETQQAVEILVPLLVHKGFQMVTVSDLIEARRIPLEKGKLIRNGRK